MQVTEKNCYHSAFKVHMPRIKDEKTSSILPSAKAGNQAENPGFQLMT